MADLEQLLRQKQDELRGRPERWTDRMGYWMRDRLDWNWIVRFVIPMVLIEVLVFMLLFRAR